MAPSNRKSWNLTEPSFRRLLEFLDADPRRAPESYEKVREKLIRFFEWKGCVPGVDYADETMDRVARKLEAGLETEPGNPYLYFHGVALNVVREHWRKAPSPETLSPLRMPSVQPLEEERRQTLALETEHRMECLQDCLDRLTPASREFLLAYHLGGRKGLAGKLSIGAGALRLRAFRIRRQMERCLNRCLETLPGNIGEK